MFSIINRAIVNVQTRMVTVQDQLTARQQGQAMVEYGLLAGLVSIAGVAGLVAIGGDVKGIFDFIALKLTVPQ